MIRSRKIIMLTVIIFAVGCGLKFGIPPCIVELEDGTNVSFVDLCAQIKADPNRKSALCDIAEKGYDPCIAHRTLEIVVKQGYIFEKYTEAQFDEWTREAVDVIKAGITIGNLKYLLINELEKLSGQAGVQVLIIGDTFMQLPQGTYIEKDDVPIIVSSINDLNKEVKRVATFYKPQ